jgi:uncharacterized protein YraI
MRTGPGKQFAEVSVLPAGTGLIFEARSADTGWLLGRTLDGAHRGWVSALYLNYSDGFSAGRLSVSMEIIGASPLAAPATMSGATTGTVTASANVRRGPGQEAAILTQLPAGMPVVLEGRNLAGDWVLVHTPDGGTRGWMTARYIAIPANTALPVTTETINTPESPTVAQLRQTPIVATATARAREIYQRGLARGNHPDRFSKVGDCQSITSHFLGVFDRGDYHLGPEYAHLQETIDHFSGSFARESESVWSGFNAYAVLDPTWANPARCAASESPIACEYRLWQPSFVIISLEVWHGGLEDYKSNLRQVLDFWISNDVVPILATKADNREGDWSVNAAIAELAAEYNVPLWNFLMAAQPLPGFGLVDGFHLSYAQCNFDSPASMQHGWPWRNLTALQSLDSVWRGVN